jgi:hypothetical protein
LIYKVFITMRKNHAGGFAGQAPDLAGGLPVRDRYSFSRDARGQVPSFAQFLWIKVCETRNMTP